MTWRYLEEQDCYCLEAIVYCRQPKAPEQQSMHIFVPAAYWNGDGTPKENGTLTTRHGAVYTAETVPVIFYNDVGGYSECLPAKLTDRNRRFLQDGYVLVSAGARGRQSRDEAGNAAGKAPAGLIDLKAAIRWLRRHRAELPGNYDRIISVGTSAGGAMSALLGVTGNCSDYLPYLEEIGAEMEERDDVFAAQCYCPIIDLDHADMAYEWMFAAKHIYTRSSSTQSRVLDAFRQQLSRRLADAYPAYVNSLGLGYTLGDDGRSGSYYEKLMKAVSDSLTKFLQLFGENDTEKQKLVEELNAGGTMIGWDGKQALIRDLDQYVLTYIGRMKGCPAFDELETGSFENQEFGTDEQDKIHFSRPVTELLLQDGGETWKSAAGEYAQAYRREAFQADTQQKTRLMNPMHWLGEAAQTDLAPHFRIRLGSRDADTSFGIAFNFYLALQASGRTEADYAMVWGRGHCDADYPGEFSAWVDGLP